MKQVRILSLLAMLFVSYAASAQTEAKPAKNTITFFTSAVCGMCEDRIEEKLNYTKGIIFSELDVETKKLTVRYKTKHISAEEIKQIVADLGYDADKTKRNEEAFNALPKCCQSEGHCESDE
ncbi:MAG: heavy-metal-associated domain-containing protein [Crocinitomicaceae bacterium]